MAVVTFVLADWQAIYPQFAATVTSAPQAQNYFNQATLYVANTDCAIIPYDPIATPPVTTRLDILYLLTAHVAQLFAGSTLGPATPLVGRISDATQGSVSVSADMTGTPGSAAWFLQTPFGAAAWQGMAPFRTAQYRASPGRFAQIPGNGPFFGAGARFGGLRGF